jgi:PAS domain S-box-containing protein
MKDGEWVEGLPAEVMVCDDQGTILEMNQAAEDLFAADGGRDLLGTNVLECHPEPSLTKLKDMLEKEITNAYLNTENGERRFFFQSPWYGFGKYAGFVEISFPVPEDIPHFIRE